MDIYIDIKKLENHISLLREEKREAQLIEELLSKIEKGGSTNISAHKALDSSRNEIINIENRIQLLERIVTRYNFVDSELKNLIDDAVVTLFQGDF